MFCITFVSLVLKRIYSSLLHRLYGFLCDYRYTYDYTNFSVSSKTSMLLWLGLLSISISLSYFFVRVFVDGVDSLDSSKLVAEPEDHEH